MTLPVEGAVRPGRIKHGDMWWESIETIMLKDSIDHGGPGKWDRLLEDKRADSHYEDVRLSIEERGFVRPLTALIREGGQDFSFGDGHHRLAAAIDLGLTMVPLEAFNADGPGYFGGAIANDSGDWNSFDDPIPEDNGSAGDSGYYEPKYEEDEDEDDFGSQDDYECGICSPGEGCNVKSKPEPEPVEAPCNCYFCRNMKN